MHIRPIEERDLPAILDVGVRAFMDDELTNWLAPRRNEYPTSYYHFFGPRPRLRFSEPGCWGFVCVPSVHAYDHDKIMGAAWWERHVGPESAPSLRAQAAATGTWDPLAAVATLNAEQKRSAKNEAFAADQWSGNNSSWWAAFNRMLASITNKFDRLMRANPSVDYKALEHLLGPAGNEEQCFEPLKDVTLWHLGSLSVDPAHQRKGVGAALVNHGLEMARKESREKGFGIPVTLTASIMGNKFYKKLGFKVVDWMELPIGNEPHLGGAAMVWDETETWIEKAGVGTLVKGREMDAVWTKIALDRAKSRGDEHA